MITWGGPIWLYLWLAGMAGGAYFAAFLADRFMGGTQKALLRLATYVGLPFAVIGVLLLIVDLGVPIRFWHLLVEFDVVSAMSIGTWILFVWVAAAVIMGILWNADRFISIEGARPAFAWITSVLSWIAFIFAALLMTYTGVLLASSNQPLWAGTVLLPCLFVASAVSTGVAAVLITAIFRRDGAISRGTIARLTEADAVVIIIEMAILIGFAIWLGVSAMGGAAEGLKILTIGALAPAFWVGVVLLALLIPLGLELRHWGKEIRGRATWLAVVVPSVCVLLGGLTLRAVIVVGGQM
jgi:formate-dependent nitrite reductase membrane component NrfD